MTMKQVLRDITENPTVKPWPHVGVALGISRGSVYDLIARNELEIIRVGRTIRVITAPLRKRLGLDVGEGE
jgi:excisionase family DNA binding protein